MLSNTSITGGFAVRGNQVLSNTSITGGFAVRGNQVLSD